MSTAVIEIINPTSIVCPIFSYILDITFSFRKNQILGHIIYQRKTNPNLTEYL